MYNHARKIGLGIFAAVILCTIIGMLVTVFTSSPFGPAWFSDWFKTTKGELVGNKYTITEYDDYGNKTLSISGENVAVSLLKNDANFDSSSSGFKSEVLEFTIDKKAAYQVGNTCIIAEDGLNMVADFSMPEDIVSSSNTGSFIPADRFVNSWKNKIGMRKTIIISSQTGIPIGIYQGKSVYVTIPDDMPKTTRIIIDDKSLYIHRANYNILDTSLIQ